MQILVADDDRSLLLALDWSLRQAGHEPTLVEDGDSADAALEKDAFDLVILDLGLPVVSGLDVLRRLRERGAAVPVLVLSACADVSMRVRSLDLGADDYVAKPFAVAELTARVRALGRRARRPTGEVVSFGSLTADLAGHIVTIAQKKVDLSARELSLLEVLLRSEGRLVMKGQLVDHLLRFGGEVGHNAVEVYVHRIRRKIENAGVHIATVPGMGYCLKVQRLEGQVQ
jgi:DNA-binding response OmpR family regulator